MTISIFKSKCTEELAKLRPNATFLSVMDYTNNFKEVSNFSICFHVNYHNAVRRAKALLEEYEPRSSHAVGRPYSIDHLRRARIDLIDSFGMTLTGHNPLATSAHAYDEVASADGTKIVGVKLHRDQDILHLWGFCMHKKVLIPTQYPPDRRMPLTVAKDDLRSMTPLGAFNQFKLTPGKFVRLTVESITLKTRDALRDLETKLVKKDWIP